MKLRYREEPKEWRKSALLTLLGLALIASLLRWRHHLSQTVWLSTLGVLVIIALAALIYPRWFRGYYRVSLWLGFYSSQFVGRCVLAIFFMCILLPLGLVLRIMGKDPLQLKRRKDGLTYWQTSKPENSLDRLF